MWSIIDILLKQNNGLPNNKIGTKFAQSFLTARSGIAIKPECVGSIESFTKHPSTGKSWGGPQWGLFCQL